MRLPIPKNSAILKEIVAMAGVLPLSGGGVAGYSVDGLYPNAPWHTGEEGDPWRMREELANDPDIVYGKFCSGRGGFCHASVYGRLLNLRRDGYDFDTRVDEGVVSARERAVMAALEASDRPLFAFELRRGAGFGKEGYAGFEQTICQLQQRCYLLVSGFARKKDRFGKEYGWEVNVYDTPERRFGPEYIANAYGEEPVDSLAALFAKARAVFPEVDPEGLLRLLSGE